MEDNMKSLEEIKKIIQLKKHRRLSYRKFKNSVWIIDLTTDGCQGIFEILKGFPKGLKGFSMVASGGMGEFSLFWNVLQVFTPEAGVNPLFLGTLIVQDFKKQWATHCSSLPTHQGMKSQKAVYNGYTGRTTLSILINREYLPGNRCFHPLKGCKKRARSWIISYWNSQHFAHKKKVTFQDLPPMLPSLYHQFYRGNHCHKHMVISQQPAIQS